MGYKEEMTLDILDLGKHILMHWRMLVLGCFMGALIAGMVTVYKGVGLSQSGPDVSEATENVNVVPGVEGVEPLTKPEFGNVTTAINNYYDYKDVLAEKMKYKEDSLLLNLYNTCVPTMERNYLISDYYEIEFPNLTKANYIENIIEMYRSAIVSDPGLRKYYLRKMKEKGGAKEAHGVVLNAVKFKIILRMFAVVRSGEPYKVLNY